MSTMAKAKTGLSAVMGALLILGLAILIYLLASTPSSGGYSLGGGLQRSGSHRNGTEGGQDAVEAINVDAVLPALDTLSTDPGLTRQLVWFSPTGFVDETSGAPSGASDLIVPHLPEVSVGLSDTAFGASGNATFGANGTPGLSLGGGGGSPGGGGGNQLASDSPTASVSEPSVLILVGTGLVSVAGAPMLSRRWRSRGARGTSGG